MPAPGCLSFWQVLPMQATSTFLPSTLSTIHMGAPYRTTKMACTVPEAALLRGRCPLAQGRTRRRPVPCSPRRPAASACAADYRGRWRLQAAARRRRHSRGRHQAQRLQQALRRSAWGLRRSVRALQQRRRSGRACRKGRRRSSSTSVRGDRGDQGCHWHSRSRSRMQGRGNQIISWVTPRGHNPRM